MPNGMTPEDWKRAEGHIATKADIARLEEQVKGLDRAIDIRLLGIERLQDERSRALRDLAGESQKAVDKAEGAQIRVNVAQNEFRQALSDQAKLLASRTEMDSLDKRVQSLERGATGGIGRSGGIEAFKSNLFAIIALLVSVGTLILMFRK